MAMVNKNHNISTDNYIQYRKYISKIKTINMVIQASICEIIYNKLIFVPDGSTRSLMSLQKTVKSKKLRKIFYGPRPF